MIPKKEPADLSILSISGYFQKHFVLCQIHKTQQDAFDALEEEYFALQKKNRYSSYESFRARKTKYYANKDNR